LGRIHAPEWLCDVDCGNPERRKNIARHAVYAQKATQTYRQH
jgi:hypothetical protein